MKTNDRSDHVHHLTMECAELQMTLFLVQNAFDSTDSAPTGLKDAIFQETGLTMDEFFERMISRLDDSALRNWPRQEVNLDSLPQVSFN